MFIRNPICKSIRATHSQTRCESQAIFANRKLAVNRKSVLDFNNANLRFCNAITEFTYALSKFTDVNKREITPFMCAVTQYTRAVSQYDNMNIIAELSNAESNVSQKWDPHFVDSLQKFSEENVEFVKTVNKFAEENPDLPIQMPFLDAYSKFNTAISKFYALAKKRS